MSLELEMKKQELRNIFNIYLAIKKEFEGIDEKQTTEKKALKIRLRTFINDKLKTNEAYETESTQQEKEAIESLLIELG